MALQTIVVLVHCFAQYFSVMLHLPVYIGRHLSGTTLAISTLSCLCSVIKLLLHVNKNIFSLLHKARERLVPLGGMLCENKY